MPRPRAFVFGGLVAFLVLFWMVGQAVTLRWQMRHLMTHTPQVVEEGTAR